MTTEWCTRTLLDDGLVSGSKSDTLVSIDTIV